MVVVWGLVVVALVVLVLVLQDHNGCARNCSLQTRHRDPIDVTRTGRPCGHLGKHGARCLVGMASQRDYCIQTHR